MDEKISPETEERIRELCRKISVAHNLDEEIHAELFAHMEDKLRAYLSGSEKLTEEDAFVLVREHFGDPEEVKAMLENVHAEAVQVGMMRRIGAISVVFMGIFCMTVMVSFALYALLNALHFRTYYSHDSVFVRFAKLIPYIAAYTCAIVMLIVWRKREQDSRSPWYIRLNPWYFVPLSLILYLLMGFCVLFAMASIFISRGDASGPSAECGGAGARPRAERGHLLAADPADDAG